MNTEVGVYRSRQRFAVAHELGHLVLHTYRRRVADRVADRVAENEADRFASAFLVPSAPARDIFAVSASLYDYGHLQAEWGVSMAALITRAWAVGVISDERRASLFKQLSARGWRRAEPVRVSPEQPALLGTLLQRRFGEHRKVYKAAQGTLGLTAVQLRSLAPTPRLPATPRLVASPA
jgi:Zn-dependent peptidase ImmA (M78 family)